MKKDKETQVSYFLKKFLQEKTLNKFSSFLSSIKQHLIILK